jgi:large subunit ribosomal protein L7/L12
MGTKNITRQDVVNFIKEMTLLDLADFIKELEETFGVTAVQMTPMPGTPIDGPVEEEKPTEFQVILDGYEDGKKIPVIKAIRQVVVGLGLKDAKDFVESAPQVVREACQTIEEAERIKKELEVDGAIISIKPVRSS